MLHHHTKSKPSKLLHSIPIICILALLTLSLITINPWKSNYKQEAYAAELTSSTNDTLAALIVDDGNIEDVILAESGVNYKSHNIKIKAANIESYTLQISASSNGTSELKLDGGNTTIPGAGGVVGSNMPTNTWGYAWGAENATEDSMTYYTLPAYGSVGTTISTGLLASDTPTNNTIDTSNKLSFAANFSDNIPSGHYTTSVLLSLAVEPKAVVKTWDTMEYMQDMTSEICASQPTPAAGVTTVPTKTLTDIRDNNTYTIAKLKDGNCWMTENLAIVGKTISNEDSDMTSGTFTIMSTDGTGWPSAQEQSMAYYDATYGGYYNWYTATAGTGNSTIVHGDAPGSICPKNWQLPIYRSAITDKSFSYLLEAIPSNADGIATITAQPYHFTYGGKIYTAPLSYAGTEGYYWSATTNSDSASSASYFLFRAKGDILPNSSDARVYGHSVRCVAR